VIDFVTLIVSFYNMFVNLLINTISLLLDGENIHAVVGSSNRRARDIINRISNKLTG